MRKMVTELSETLFPDEPGPTAKSNESVSEQYIDTCDAPATLADDGELSNASNLEEADGLTIYPGRMGRYILRHELGYGGMGVVWEAYDSQLKRPVAIKFLKNLNDPSGRRRRQFEKEAQTVARLQTPHVVRIYDYGINNDEQPYIVMELLHGEDLHQRLERVKHLSPHVWAVFLSQICEALTAAHEAGIIHRDIKPANVFLEKQGFKERVKILDFGIATIPSDAKSYSPRLEFRGSPAYVSPEVVLSEPLDARTDLWSLGVVTYQVLTGVLPFWDDSLKQLLTRILDYPVTAPSDLVANLTTELDSFIRRALSKKRDQRFSNVSQMEAAYFAALPKNDSSTAKILVVDDEPDWEDLVRQYFRRQVAKKDYEFHFAPNGLEGLRELEKHPDIDVIFTDIRMPDMDGLTFLSKLKKYAPLPRAIVVSAFSDMQNVRLAMNYGAFDFLMKPVDFEDLEITLKKGIQESRQLRRAQQFMKENESLRLLVAQGYSEMSEVLYE